MNYVFGEHEANFRQWRQDRYPGVPEVAKEFLIRLEAGFSPTPLYKHQTEAIQRCIYSFEILGIKDALTNIVTGGGKTVIIGGIIAYMRQVHGIRQHLILVPNTIVRER